MPMVHIHGVSVHAGTVEKRAVDGMTGAIPAIHLCISISISISMNDLR